eukprot:s1647_g5.t2
MRLGKTIFEFIRAASTLSSPPTPLFEIISSFKKPLSEMTAPLRKHISWVARQATKGPPKQDAAVRGLVQFAKNKSFDMDSKTQARTVDMMELASMKKIQAVAIFKCHRKALAKKLQKSLVARDVPQKVIDDITCEVENIPEYNDYFNSFATDANGEGTMFKMKANIAPADPENPDGNLVSVAIAVCGASFDTAKEVEDVIEERVPMYRWEMRIEQLRQDGIFDTYYKDVPVQYQVQCGERVTKTPVFKKNKLTAEVVQDIQNYLEMQCLNEVKQIHGHQKQGEVAWDTLDADDFLFSKLDVVGVPGSACFLVNHQTLHHPGARNKPAPFDAAKRYIYQQVLQSPLAEILRKFNADDMELYEHGRRLFESQKRAVPQVKSLHSTDLSSSVWVQYHHELNATSGVAQSQNRKRMADRLHDNEDVQFFKRQASPQVGDRRKDHLRSQLLGGAQGSLSRHGDIRAFREVTGQGGDSPPGSRSPGRRRNFVQTNLLDSHEEVRFFREAIKAQAQAPQLFWGQV